MTFTVAVLPDIVTPFSTFVHNGLTTSTNTAELSSVLSVYDVSFTPTVIVFATFVFPDLSVTLPPGTAIVTGPLKSK